MAVAQAGKLSLSLLDASSLDGRVAAPPGREMPRSGPFLPRSGRNHARAARAQRNFRKISYFSQGNSAKFSKAALRAGPRYARALRAPLRGYDLAVPRIAAWRSTD